MKIARAANRLMQTVWSTKDAEVKERVKSVATDSRLGKNWGLKPPALVVCLFISFDVCEGALRGCQLQNAQFQLLATVC